MIAKKDMTSDNLIYTIFFVFKETSNGESFPKTYDFNRNGAFLVRIYIDCVDIQNNKGLYIIIIF